MPYNIIFKKREQTIGTTPWNGDLDSAKRHAEEHMAINKADRVEVRSDDDDKLVFQHPRTLHA